VPDDRSSDIPAQVYLPEVFSGAEWRACSRGNWFWLVDLPAHGLALELSVGEPTFEAVLKGRFETVRHFDLAPAGVLPLPISNAVVDCALLHRPWPSNDSPNVTALLSECARVLRPGGCLLLALDHPLSIGRSSIGHWLPRALLAAPGAVFRRWLGRLSGEQSAPWPLYGLTGQLGTVGFTEVRPYYVLPTIDAPQQMVPAYQAAMAVHEAHQGNTGVRRALRRVLLKAGAEAAFFPGFLLIAVR
jgi:SAM-dependent methyltransferase